MFKACEGLDLSLSLTIQQESNARINRAGDNEPSIRVLRMKAALFPLRFNELLDSSRAQ
jgi:hypothetical protein